MAELPVSTGLADAVDRPPATLEQWVATTLPRALAFARSLVRDPHVAEDLVQECYGKLWRHRERYDLIRDGWKILLRSLTHAGIDRSRRERRLTAVESERIEDPSTGTHRNHRFPDPARAAEGAELDEAIAAALETLTEPQRIAMQLRSLGSEISEIAETLGISENHAAVHLHRARKQLRVRLAKFLSADEPTARSPADSS